MVEITEQPQGPVVEGSTSAAWTPIKSPFKVPTVEQTQEAVYSLLQLTDFRELVSLHTDYKTCKIKTECLYIRD